VHCVDIFPPKRPLIQSLKKSVILKYLLTPEFNCSIWIKDVCMQMYAHGFTHCLITL